MPFIDEIAAHLQNAGVGTVGGTIKLGSGAIIPRSDPTSATAYLTLVETGGSGPGRTHDVKWQRPTAQITVRANTYNAARAMAKAAYDALDGQFNVTLSGTVYQRIVARQEPTDLGLEPGTERRMIVFNIEAEKLPS